MTDIGFRAPRAHAAGALLLGGNYADPNLIVFDGRYFLYPTTDGHADWGATSFRAFSSDDLVHWEDHGEILRLGADVGWASSGAWAPCVVGRNGRYYLYFTAERSIGVAVSDAPTGPFRDLGRPLVAGDAYPGQMIDPSVFFDEDGTGYLLWGNMHAYAVRLGDDLMSFDASDVVEWQLPGFREAAWLHRRDGLYYLSWSENDTREADYRVRYATGPTALGPWTDRGVLIEKSPRDGILATGHHSIVRLPGTDDWILAYHRFAIPGGDGFHRDIAFERLRYESTGLIAPVTPSRERLRAPLRSDSFDGEADGKEERQST